MRHAILVYSIRYYIGADRYEHRGNTSICINPSSFKNTDELIEELQKCVARKYWVDKIDLPVDVVIENIIWID